MALIIFFLVTLLSSSIYQRCAANVRIHGGEKVRDIEEMPHQLSLRNSENRIVCSAVLIHVSYALTAAHCINNGPDSIYLVAGQLDANIRDNTLKLYVSDVFIHKDYNEKGKDNDIAVLRLKEPVEITSKVNIIQMSTLDDKSLIGIYCNASGWGETKNKDTSTDLIYITIPILPHDDNCIKPYKNDNITITDSMICAGIKGKDSCKFDSGGPLVYNKTLVGIINFGYESCDSSNPGIYLSISSYRTWIEEIINAEHSSSNVLCNNFNMFIIVICLILFRLYEL